MTRVVKIGGRTQADPALPASIAASWLADEAKWRDTRAKYLLY